MKKLVISGFAHDKVKNFVKSHMDIDLSKEDCEKAMSFLGIRKKGKMIYSQRIDPDPENGTFELVIQ